MAAKPFQALILRPAAGRAILALFAGVLLFGGFTDAPLSANDTALHGGIARRMAERGDWGTPSLYGEPWFEHLPPFLWMTAASYRLFGVNAGAARLPHLLLALITVLAVFELARLRFGTLAGLFAGVALTTTEMYWRYAARVRPDIAMTAGITLALLFLVLARERSQPRWLLGFGLSIGFAAFCKGPMAIVPLVALAAGELIARKTGEPLLLRSRWLYLGLLLGALVPLPWVIYQFAAHGSAWFDRYVIHQIFWLPLHGATGAHDYWVVPRVLLRIYWPHVAVLIFGFVQLFRKWRSAGASLIAVGCAGLFVALAVSLSSRQTEYYVLPAFPAFSVIIGWQLSALISRPGRQAAATLVILGLAAAAAVVLAVTPLQPRLGELEKETARVAAIVPWVRSELALGERELGIFELHPDRTAWPLELYLDLPKPPRALEGEEEAVRFLEAPQRVLLLPEARAAAILARAPQAVKLGDASGIAVLANHGGAALNAGAPAAPR